MKKSSFNLKWRIIIPVLLIGLLCCMFAKSAYAATKINVSPYAEIEYGNTGNVKCGTIRYVQQNSGQYYYSNYWSPANESIANWNCYAASVSMALSYVGANRSPGTIYAGGNYHAQPGATVQYPSLTNAINNYLSGNGKYSPVVINVIPYGGRGAGSQHWVIIAGHVSGNTYRIVDPWNGAHGTSWDATINGNTMSYWGYCTDTIKQVLQYYNPNGRIDNDTERPQISNVRYSNLSSSGYTVTCTVTDNKGVTVVKFPTWTAKVVNGTNQDDLVWHVGALNGNTATFNVKVSDHKSESGQYYTHIYAYDASGNEGFSTGVSPVVPPAEPPKICSTPQISASDSIGGKTLSISYNSAETLTYTIKRDNVVIADNATDTGRTGKYTLDLKVAGTYTVWAKTARSGYQTSEANKAISLTQVGKPQISQTATSTNMVVNVNSPTNGASIYYTLSGNSPSISSNLYAGVITLKEQKTVKAFAAKKGMADSEITEYVVKMEEPSTPEGLTLEGESIIPQGDTVSVKWSSASLAAGYVATLYKGMDKIQTLESVGTSASFVLSEAGEYTVNVYATNFVGNSAETDSPISVTAMAPSTVTFKDWDGTILATQEIRYGKAGTLPTTDPSRRGYTFLYWNNADRISSVKEDIELTAEYKINTYSVRFYNGKGNQVGPAQKITFGSSASSPEADLDDIPTGYVFAGWQVTEASDDSDRDYTSVDCDMKLKAVYVWHDNELPVVVEIVNARQNIDTKNYNVVIKLTNYPEDMTTALLRVSLYTDSGMMVKSVKSEFEVNRDGNTTKTVTLKYSGIATKASAVVLGINGDDLTGSAYSAQATAGVMIKSDEVWSDWSEEKPNDPDGGEIETRTQYRFATKNTADNTSPNMEGWTSTGVTYSPGEWSPWSGWSTAAQSEAYSHDYKIREVRQEPAYRYYCYHCPNNHREPYSGRCDGCGYNLTDSNIEEAWSHTPYTACNAQKVQYIFGGTQKYYTTSIVPNSMMYFTGAYMQQTSPGTLDVWLNAYIIRAEYQYRTRKVVSTYHYYKWSDWSEWSDTVYTENDTTKVETRTLYRQLVSKYSPIAPDEEVEGSVYHFEGNLSSIDMDLSGKLATIMVYKGWNTDPNEDQIQYVGQTSLGDENAYNFDVIPKADPTPTTGDYTVCLGVQGSTGLINVGLIRYKRNVYTVEFIDDDGSEISSQQVEEGSNAEIPPSPHKDGFYFVGWSDTATNVQGNMSIVAQYTSAEYVITYVDSVNGTISYETYHYGDELTPPEAPTAVGREFVGWDAVLDGVTYVTQNMVVNAVYIIQSYTVEFVDEKGSVINSQNVEYGNAAIPPAALDISGKEFLGWSTEKEWWDVKENMTVTPILAYMFTAESPSYYFTEYEDYVGLYLDSSTEGATIYYSLDGTEPTSDSPSYDGNGIVLNNFDTEIIETETGYVISDTADIYTLTVCEGMNDSDVQLIEYKKQTVVNHSGNACLVEFDINGQGTPLEMPYVYVSTGEELRTLPVPEWENYSFEGWFTAVEGGSQVSEETIISEDVTLYAHWKKMEEVHEHTVVIDPAVSPTCMQEGRTEGSHCYDCGEVLVEQQVIPKTDHAWDDGVITTEPTCSLKGERTFTCMVCGEEKTETINTTAHTPANATAIDPTCTESGRTAGTYCILCGEVIEGMEEIPVTEHSFLEWTVVKEATCQTHGLEEHTCSVCGEKETRETALVDHITAVRGASDASCQQDGYTGDTYCTVCGEVLKTGEAIPKLEHSWDEGSVLTASTCQSKGITRYTCSVCGEKRYEELPLGNHVGGKATCHDKAICIVCGEEYGELNPERHAGGTEVRNHVDATSTDEGYTGDTYCKGCGNLTKAGEIIPVLPPENERSIRVQNTSGMVGKDVVIPVTIEKNSGIAGFSFDILYDENILTLKSAAAGSVLSTGQVSTNGNVVNWYTTDNIMDNGEILLLTFTIADEAEAGVTQVRVEPHGGKKNLVDEAGNYVDVNYQTGKLDVQRGILGDVNGDTDITIADVVLLNRCVLGKQELSPDVLNYADVNGDFDITIGDVVLLNRHVLGKESLESAIEYLSMMEDYLGGGGYAVIRVEDVLVKPGATIGVPVYIEDNTGIAGMALSVALPKGVKLNSITKGSVLSSGNFQYDGDSCTWYSSEGVFGDGLLMTLNITADEEAYSGSIKVGARDNDANNLTDEHGGTMAIDYIAGSLAIDYDELCETNGHNAGDAVIENEVEATCQGGSYDLVVYCTECHEEISRETVTLPAVDHQWDDEYSVDVPATCTEEGTESIHCSVCGTVKEGTERTIEKTPHDFGDWVTVNGASCTEAGLEKKVCSTCGTEETREIPATGHTMNKVDAVAETCEADGNIAYWHCSVCMKDFLNEDGTEELTTEQIILPATGHTWGRGIITKEATAEEDGEKTFTCEVCGKTKIEPYSYLGETVVHARAFADNENLKDITIGASVVKIEDEAFAGCSNLKEIYFEGDLPELGQDVFRDIDPDAVIYYPDGNETWTQQALQEAGVNLRTAAWNPSTGNVVIKDLADCSVTLEYQQVTYDGTSKQPSVTVKAGQMELKAGTDYTVTYGENVDAGTGTVDVSGQGNYTGSAQTTFMIAKAQGKIVLTETSKIVNVGDAGFDLQVKEVVTDGQVTFASSDPSVATVDPVSGSVQIIAEGTTNLIASTSGVNYTNETATLVLTVRGTSAQKTDNVITASGKTVKGTGRAQSVALKAAVLGDAKLSYKSDRSNVKVNGNGVLSVPATFAGRVRVTISSEETDDYKPASKTVDVIVLPTAPVLSKVKASGSKKAKVTWKRNVTAQGYELQYATNKAFTKKLKTVTIGSQKTVKKKVKKLKGGKKYYFRIRSYVTVNGKKYYSGWSNVKKAKIKK